MKKKGFTLIELLAVIIILAVIALIATPIVMDIIETVKIKSAEASAKGYARAVEYVLINKDFELSDVNSGIYDGQYDVEENTLGVTYEGKGPSDGFYIVDNNYVSYGELCINGYPIKYENGYGKYSPKDVTCKGVQPEPPGEYASLLCKEDINYDNETIFKIKTVEDLVCISNQVNKNNKTFEGKELILINDIDINNNNSYLNINDSYGDINENGIEEGIKVELTTEKGFLPIGNNKTNFKGSFNGNMYTLSNMYINRPEEDYVGLFGYINNGTIEGLNISNFNITGNNYVGSISGYSSGSGGAFNSNILGINMYNANIEGNKYVGGVIGQAGAYSHVKEIVFEGNVSGNNYVGGISGYNGVEARGFIVRNVNVKGTDHVAGIAYPSSIGIIESGTITGNTKYVGQTGNRQSYFTDSVIVEVPDGITCETSYAGINYKLGKNILSGYDTVLDTYIGGDNDSSGYYFDYENDTSDKIVIKSIEKDPLDFKLQGSGTEDSPYIINNVNDWKQATLKVKGDYYFKINNDIDFTDKHFYMLGTEQNNFTGKLNGDMHTLSNIELTGLGYVGIIGRIFNGTIEGLNIDTITVKGNNYVGGISGYSSGSGGAFNSNILGINMYNANIEGNKYAGGVIGQAGAYSHVKEIVFEGNVSGNDYVGGISGYNGVDARGFIVRNVNVKGTDHVAGITYPSSIGIIESGTIIGNTKYVGQTGSRQSYFTDSVIVEVPDGITCETSYAGINYSIDDINDLGYYSSLKNSNTPIIESEITGDVNNSGYYFAYGSDGYIRVVKVGSPSIAPKPPKDETYTVDSSYTMTSGENPPTCELYYIIPVANGIQSKFSCTDDNGAPTVKSLFDSTTEKSAKTFEEIGTTKTGSISDNTRNVLSTWTIYDPISQPTRGTCYYYRYGAMDSEGNWSTYVTDKCYRGFSN